MQERYYIYLDIVFLINLLMDYLILWATASLGQFATSFKKLLIASFLGAAYSLAIFLPPTGLWMSFGAKVLFSLLMVFCAFYPLGWKKFCQATGYFYLVAFAVGGAMLGAMYIVDSNAFAYSTMNGVLVSLSNVTYTWLVIAVASALVIGRWGAVAIRKNFLDHMFQIPVIICLGRHRMPVKALVDTGNQLKDPLTRNPVVVVEYGALKNVLPPQFIAAFESDQEPDVAALVASVSNSNWAHRIRIIPFNSIGKAKGLLLGFCPDEVIVLIRDHPVRVENAVVGVYQKSLSPEGKYRALLHPEILQAAMKV